MSPRVAVPAPGGGGGGGGWGVQGCYRIQGTIYGPYRMEFCLKGRGNGDYKVKGGGLDCKGGLDWYFNNRGRLDIDLYRSFCGRGTQWTGDAMKCQTGWSPFGKSGPKIAVPAPIGGGTLNCRYLPQTSGYSPIQVTAVRK
jgi:hypothetical protein